MDSLTSQMQVSQQRSKPLRHADMFLNWEHWDAVKKLAKQRDITALELVRRLIADELRRESRRTK